MDRRPLHIIIGFIQHSLPLICIKQLTNTAAMANIHYFVHYTICTYTILEAVKIPLQALCCSDKNLLIVPHMPLVLSAKALCASAYLQRGIPCLTTVNIPNIACHQQLAKCLRFACDFWQCIKFVWLTDYTVWHHLQIIWGCCIFQDCLG